MSTGQNSEYSQNLLSDDQKMSKNSGEKSPSEKLIQDDERDETQQTNQEKYGMFGCWDWWRADMWGRKSFFMWCIFGILTILYIIIYYADSSKKHVASLAIIGVVIILIIIYGYRHFWLLLAIREQANEFEESNRNFKLENRQLASEVDRLDKAKMELQNTENILKDAKIQNEKNLAQFRELDKNLKASGSSNLEQLKVVQERSKNMMETWRQEMIGAEKNMIMEVFDRVDDYDEVEGISTKQFGQFLDLLPSQYAPRRLALKKAFNEAKGDDDQLQNDEFEKVLDAWVGDCVDQELERQEKKLHDTDDQKSPE